MSLPRITLKPGREVPIHSGHPWIFSQAIAQDVDVPAGELVEVFSPSGAFLGIGTHNKNTSIRARILTRERETIDAAFFADRFRALASWKESRLPALTNGYRLVHAEADNIPGLIVDRFADVFVFQLHTAGMERFRKEIIEALKNVFEPKAIVERSDIDVRRIEGLTDQPVNVHEGTVTDLVSFQEAGITFLADVLKGQKTGFFLDQREARLALQTYSKNKRVLNLFSYSGAFSVHAAQAGASFVANVDSSRSALELAEKNLEANGFNPGDEKKFLSLDADIMELLSDADMPGAPYDVIVCDPPAFAKNDRQLPNAIKAYTDLNSACFKQLKPGGILITSSCSGRVEPEAFRSLLRIAAGKARRDVRLLGWITQPVDHAERIAFPEGRYLKTAILEVTDILK